VSLAFNRRTGTARLCFLAENAFVGVAELELDGGLVAVQLTGTEAAKECAREMCNCCPEMSFRVTVAGTPLRGGRQSFVALDKALGDHAAFEGRGISFQVGGRALSRALTLTLTLALAFALALALALGLCVRLSPPSPSPSPSPCSSPSPSLSPSPSRRMTC